MAGGLSRLAEFVRVDFLEFFSRGDDGDDPASGDEVKVLMGADWGGHALTALARCRAFLFEANPCFCDRRLGRLLRCELCVVAGGFGIDGELGEVDFLFHGGEF